MKRKIFIKSSVLLAFAVSALLFYAGVTIGRPARSSAPGNGNALAAENRKATVVFKVRCYDEGKAALQGLKGIERIKTGFHYLYETDTVTYDPAVITVGEMEAALKQAGTYVGTISAKERD